MALDIRPAGPENLSDWLTFFDREGFSDNPDWSGCYCQFYFEADEALWSSSTKEQNREAAAERIRTGRMKGLLAYLDGKPVGWVHADDRTVFPRLCAEPGYLEAGARFAPLDPASEPMGRGKSIVCYLIHPAYRGQGIATALLQRVLADAPEEGYAYVEAFPFRNASTCAMHYHGPAEMYEKAGFQKVMTLDEVEIWRRKV